MIWQCEDTRKHISIKIDKALFLLILALTPNDLQTKLAFRRAMGVTEKRIKLLEHHEKLQRTQFELNAIDGDVDV